MKPFVFFIVTFGCKVSQYESQSVREHWTSIGGRETADPALADVALVASCAVTAEAVSDARQMVRKLGRVAPGVKIVVTGCAASAEPEDFNLPGVTSVVPQREKQRLLLGHPMDDGFLPARGMFDAEAPPDAPAEVPADAPAEAPVEASADEVAGIPTDRPTGISGPVDARRYPPFRIKGFQRARPVLKVQDGCSHRCTYCIVPLTRGPACSREPDEILAEAGRLLDAGYREIMVSGINLRQYHQPGMNFWGLLRRLDKEFIPKWEGRARFRLSSLEPAQLDAEGLETLESCRLLCPHLHLSLQSGSSAVLRRMGREHYGPEDALEGVTRLHRFWPVFGLGADILMGFPGESEAETEETLRLVNALPLTYAHVFPWSSRPGTKAAALPDQLPRKLRQEHAARVRALIAVKHEAFMQAQAALPAFHVALDGDGGQCGINEFYAPCVLEGAGHELHACRPLAIKDGKLMCA